MQSDTTYPLWIGGEPVAGSNGTYDIINPGDESLVGRAPFASRADAQTAAQAAAAAFPAWSRTSPEMRADLLTKAADALERSPLFRGLLQAETGSTVSFAAVAVPNVLARFRRYAIGALEPRDTAFPPQLGAIGPPELSARGTVISANASRRPVGVVTCITAYNVPLSNVAGKIAPALAMGNTVVIKPAPQDPLGVIKFVELMHEVGFPPGVVNLVVSPDADVSEELVASPAVDMVSFTGSSEVGCKIAEAAGRGMKRLLLELGGKGAAIVFASADLEKAASDISSTFSLHAGQICTSPTRVLVHRSVYDQVVSRLCVLANTMPVGDPTNPATVVGPVITEAHRNRVDRMIASAKNGGCSILAGGTRPSVEQGFYIAPTIIADCFPDAEVVRNEIFGPVISCVAFDDEDEVIAMANNTDYGLYDYIWTGDTSQGLRVAGQLRTGGVGVNTIARHREGPFGGFKRSGVGRDWGSYGLHAYSELQNVVWSS